jgi:AcrR family transcriptional regulator
LPNVRAARGSRPSGGAAEESPRAVGRPVGASGDRTRERVLKAALEAFAEQGFAGTSMRDIARTARIRSPSLYHYFPSKESLYEAVQQRMAEEMCEVIVSAMSRSHDLPSMARETVGRLFDFLLANRAYVQLGFHHRLDGGAPFDRRITDRWLGLMDGLMRPAELQGTLKMVDPTLLLITADGLIHWHLANDFYYRVLLGKGLEDPEIARRARDHVIQVILDVARRFPVIRFDAANGYCLSASHAASSLTFYWDSGAGGLQPAGSAGCPVTTTGTAGGPPLVG